MQVASARGQVQVASARSQVQVASAWSQVQLASAWSQVQVASADDFKGRIRKCVSTCRFDVTDIYFLHGFFYKLLCR